MAKTNLIGLLLPGTGTLSGQWGGAVNNAISQVIDVAVAGTLEITADADVALTVTEGTYNSTGLIATSAQYAVILWTAGGTVTRTITVPAQSKTYVVINKTSSSQSIIIKGVTGTGVTVAAGTQAIVAFDGTNFVSVGGGSAAGTNTQVQFNDSSALGGSAGLTWDGTTLTSTGFGGPLDTNVAAAKLTVSGTSVVASGTDVDISLTLTPKGTGVVTTGKTYSDVSGKLRAIPQSGSAKTASYTLVTTDVGQFIELGASGAIVVPDATFAAGDAVVLFNNTSGDITITLSITTAYLAGADADEATLTLATRGICNILFISGTVCVVSGNVS